MSFAVVKILEGSPRATFTIGMTIPIALLMGSIMRGESHGLRLRAASLLGVGLLFLWCFMATRLRTCGWHRTLSLSFGTLVACVAAYGPFASVLPVWLLLVPRDYLSSYMKLGTLSVLIVAIMVVNPELRSWAFTQFVHGGGPIIKGKVFLFRLSPSHAAR